MRWIICLLGIALSSANLLAQTGAVVREIRYDAALADNEARFAVTLDLDVTGKDEVMLPLFDGEVAVLTTKLPAHLRLSRKGNQYRLSADREGRYKFTLDVVAKISRKEPWNQVTITGPEAVLGSVAAQATGAGIEVQLLSGTWRKSGACSARIGRWRCGGRARRRRSHARRC
jgi:hypothetical protein